ncbi:MAG: TRAM domain-containing protein [Candidatus Marinimicrobia bacterium]|nr:TRAM domain-containing protein [Candidatus Neomarinimicrobiota bacterium]
MLDQELEITITDVAFGGAGVARHNGQVLFVPHTLPAERVRVRVRAAHPRYLEAELLEVLDPAADRQEPVCRWFGRCGGCCYQHVSAGGQAALKHGQVVAALERIGRCAAPPVSALVPAPQPFGYRNKITLHGPGRPGFLARDGRTRLPVADCPLARPPVNACLAELLAVDFTTAGDLVVRAAREGAPWWYQNPAAPADPPVSNYTESFGGCEIEQPGRGFAQVNPAQADALLAQWRSAAAAAPPACWIDPYAGAGFPSLLCAGPETELRLAELEPEAWACARRNARRLGRRLARATAAGSAERLLPRLLDGAPPAQTLVVLDPPRAGCSASVLKTLIKHRPGRIWYLSCNPPCFARDLRALSAAGYRLTRATPFDFFPQTAHIEIWAELIAAG